MSDTEILAIPVDTSEFDSFLEKYSKYREELGEQASAWGGTNEQVSKLKTSFDKVLQDFQHIEGLSGSPKLSGQSSFISNFSKTSDHVEKSWSKISRDVGVTHRNLSGIERMPIKIGAFGTSLLGGAVAAGSAVFGATVGAANDVASQNASNRALGLKPGEQASFDAHYQKMGGSDALLAKISQAKVDPSKWAGLLQGGVSVEDIRTKSPTEIAAQFLENAGARFKQMGSAAGPWATGTHVTDFADIGTLRQASSYNHDEYARTHGEYENDVPKLALKQQEMDAGTKSKEALDVLFDEVKTSFEQTFIKLAPQLSVFAKGVADGINAYSKSGELKDDIDKVVVAMKDLAGVADEVVKKLNSLTGDKYVTDKQKANGDNPSLRGGSFAAKAYGYTNDLIDAWHGNVHAPSDTSKDILFRWDWNQSNKTAAAGNADLSSLDQANGFQPGFLKNIERQESSNGRSMGSATNDSAGPAGWFQIDKATAQRLGVTDRMSEQDSAAGAAKDFSQLLQKYHGDTAAAIASYDGFAGLDKDIAQYGNKWRDHLDEFGTGKAVAETKKYLHDIAANGTDLRYQGDSNQAFIAQELGKHAKSLKGTATADDNSVLNGQKLFSMPQAVHQQTLPVANINITTTPGSSVQTSMGGLTA